MNRESNILLSLVRSSIGHKASDTNLYNNVNWQKVMHLAEEQGVLAIVFDSIETMQPEQRPDMDTLMDWLGQVSYMETCYEKHQKAIRELARFYDEQAVKMMVLKGYGLSKNFPKPNHRPVGDIDIYNFGLWRFADQMISNRLGIKVDDSLEHHTVFTYNGILVENHYDFFNTKSEKGNALMDARLKELVANGGELKDAEIKNLYYPSPNLNALYLIRHCAAHFASIGFTIRQLLDWLLFVKVLNDQIDWNMLYSDLRRYNLDRFANSMNAIGICYLGFDESLFPEYEKDNKLVDRIVNDMFNPEFTEKEDGTLVGGIWVKSHRWWHNRWKHRICSADSMWSSFWHGFYSKLLKPAHFKH